MMRMLDPATTTVVPIDLVGLCVGEQDTNGSSKQSFGTKDFARLAPDFSLLPYADAGAPQNWGPFTSDQVLAATFQGATQPLGTGIHLHWSLPQDLTHGAQDSTGKIVFPAAPNRWLVTRIATNTASPESPVTATTAWIVESDRLWDEANDTVPLPDQNAISLDVPIQPNPTAISNKSWQTLGRVFPYAGWREDAAAPRASLTALGFGDPAYAATYEYCCNVFGLWDPLTDLDTVEFPPATTRLSYQLVGWHADGVDDPIEAGRTVYQALLIDIPWDSSRRYIAPRTPSADLQIAVGNTAAEAMAALLAAQSDLADLPNVETILNALQAGLLDRLTLPGGLTDIDEILHQKDFASTSQATLWRIQPVDNPTGRPLQNGVARKARMTMPTGVGAVLDTLNATQAALDDAQAQATSLRARIFTDWYRYMAIVYPPPSKPTSTISPNDARTFIENEIAALKTMLTAAGALRNDVDTQAALVRSAIGATLELVATDGMRSWNPADPVLLFSGSDVDPAYRVRLPRARDAAGRLVTRMASDIVDMMTVDGSFTVHGYALPTLSPPPAIEIAPVAAALLAEAFFVDPWQAPVLAAAVAALGGANNPATTDFAGLVTAIAAAQGTLDQATETPPTVTFTGTPAPAAVTSWASPWTPIILQWQTTYHANVLPPYPAGLIVDNYTLDDGDIDLRYTGKVPADAANARTYSGTIVLAHDTEIDLAQQIRTYIGNFPDTPLSTELSTILADMNMKVQAQAMSGFNQSLLMLDRVLQMEVSDPLAILQGLFFSRFTNTDVKNAVGAANIDAPLGNDSFGPVRNGAFSIDQLRIVDTFGQILDINAPVVIRAASLVPHDDTAGLVDMPVRFTQATQLRFDWLSAASDSVVTNSDPATSPVFGWLLYNHLDSALAIYDSGGTALGSFNLLGAFWQGAPGNSAVYDQPIAKVFATANPHLRAFALGLAAAADPVGYLGEMLGAIDTATSLIAPQNHRQDSGLAVLIGRPLALVRSALKLRTLGLPAMDQSMAAFATAIAGGDVLNRADGDVAAITVPVRLGDLSDIDDGLVGYFLEDGTAATYQVFYAAAAASGDSQGVVQPGFAQIVVTADPSTPPVFVTMIVDPAAAIHATTGLLPMKALTIAPAMVADAMQAIAVTFLTAPVIAADLFEVPTPNESGFSWTWVTQSSQTDGWTIGAVGSETRAIASGPRRAVEGWLRLAPNPTPPPSPSD